jgi:hypothetical protein
MYGSGLQTQHVNGPLVVNFLGVRFCLNAQIFSGLVVTKTKAFLEFFEGFVKTKKGFWDLVH